MVPRWAVVIVLLTASQGGCGLVDTRPAPLARTCAEWSRLGAEERLQTMEALIEPRLMVSVRERQHLSADTPDDDVLLAAGSSIDKICELERRPGLPLTEIVTSLYR
jgi:hypothetical protein